MRNVETICLVLLLRLLLGPERVITMRGNHENDQFALGGAHLIFTTGSEEGRKARDKVLGHVQ